MTRTRHLTRYAFALLLSFAFLIPAAFAQKMVSVDRPEINMRSGPGTDHEALWLLIRGYPLAVIGEQGKWLKVRDFENDEGWVYGPLTGEKPHFVVKGTNVNVRSGPGTRNRVVGKAEYGEVLRTVETRGDWVKVRNAAGLTGWISRSLLWGW
jgi:SH3-like domain-containing protein